MKRASVTVEICVLLRICGWRFSNKFDISIGDTVPYSCDTVGRENVASYTLFAAVP